MKEFTFDRAFAPGCTQDEVYNEVGGPIVDAVMKGYNGTVLAYGQTVRAAIPLTPVCTPGVCNPSYAPLYLTSVLSAESL